MRLAMILGVCLLLASCSSSNGNGPNSPGPEKDKSKVNNKQNNNQKPDKDPRDKYPPYALYLQNKISPSVSGAKKFSDVNVKFRFQKGAMASDAAFIISVDKVQTQGDTWVVDYKVKEKLKIKNALLDQAQRFQFAVENGRASFNMTKDAIIGSQYIILIKLVKDDSGQDSYNYYWQLYPDTAEVRDELVKLDG